MQDVKKLGGGNAFPFIKIGKEVVIGYNPEKFSILLESNKWKKWILKKGKLH